MGQAHWFSKERGKLEQLGLREVPRGYALRKKAHDGGLTLGYIERIFYGEHNKNMLSIISL